MKLLKRLKEKKIEGAFNEVKKEETLKDIEYFLKDANDIFDHDEISESDWQFIFDLIDQINFIADTNTKRFIEDMEVEKNGNCWFNH